MRDSSEARVVTALLLAVFVFSAASHAQTAEERSAAATPVVSLPSLFAAEPLTAPPFDLGQVLPQPAGPPPTPRHTGIKAMVKGLVKDFTYLPSRENLFWAGVGGGLALAVHPWDDNVNQALVGNSAAENFFKAGEILGELPTLLASASVIY